MRLYNFDFCNVQPTKREAEQGRISILGKFASQPPLGGRLARSHERASERVYVALADTLYLSTYVICRWIGYRLTS